MLSFENSTGTLINCSIVQNFGQMAGAILVDKGSDVAIKYTVCRRR